MQIEYGSYRWVTAELSGITIYVVKGFNRINRIFGVEEFRVPTTTELRRVWRLNETPLSLAKSNFEEYDLMVFGPHTSEEEKDERGRPRMYSPEIVLVGTKVPKMIEQFRIAAEDEAETLAKHYSLIFNRRMLSLSFPPQRYAVKARIRLI